MSLASKQLLCHLEFAANDDTFKLCSSFQKPNLSEIEFKRFLSMLQGADPGFLERGFICIKVWGFALLILSNFS